MQIQCFVVFVSLLHSAIICSATAINCSQTRLAGSPGPFKLKHAVIREANETCIRIQSKNLTVHTEGYKLTTSARPYSYQACAFALSQLVQKCIVNGGSFGGVLEFESIAYNLTNERYPDSPLWHKPSRSTSSSGTLSTTGTGYCQKSTAPAVQASRVLQAFENANSSVANLQKSNDSLAARQTAKDAIDHAADVADRACVGSLTVALSQAVTAIAAAVGGSSSALSSFLGFWDSSVQSAAVHYKEDQHKTQNSRTVSSLSTTSPSSFSSSSTSASKTCQYPTATASRVTETQVGATAYPVKIRTQGVIGACLKLPPATAPGVPWSPQRLVKRFSTDQGLLRATNLKKPLTEFLKEKYTREVAFLKSIVHHNFIAVRGKPGPAIKEVAEVCKSDYAFLNTDHVFEKVLPAKFLASLNREENCSQDYCQILHDILSSTDETGVSLIQRWYNLLPAFSGTNDQELSITNPGLVPIDERVNGMKGRIINDGLEKTYDQGFSKKDFEEKFDILEDVALVFDYSRFEFVKQAFLATHKQMVEFLQNEDKMIQSVYGNRFTLSLADTYVVWITNYMSMVGPRAYAWANKVGTALLESDLESDEKQKLEALLQNSEIWGPEKFVFDWLPPSNNAAIAKRSIGDAATACTLSKAQSTSSSTTLTMPTTAPTCPPVSLWSVPDFEVFVPTGPPGQESFQISYYKATFPNLFQSQFLWTFSAPMGILAQFNMTFINSTATPPTGLVFGNSTCIAFKIPDDSSDITGITISGILQPGVTGVKGYMLSLTGYGAGLSTCGALQPNCLDPPATTPSAFTTTIESSMVTSSTAASTFFSSLSSANSTSSTVAICTPSLINNPTFVSSIQRDHTSFVIGYDNASVPSNFVEGAYYTFNAPYGNLTSFSVLESPDVLLQSNSTNCLTFQFKSASGGPELNLDGVLQAFLTANSQYELVLTSYGQLPNCEGVALGCANPPDPIPAPLSTYTYTQPAQRTGEPPPCYHNNCCPGKLYCG